MKIKVKIIPLVEDSLGAIHKQFGNRLKQIGITLGTAQVQKTVLLCNTHTHIYIYIFIYIYMLIYYNYLFLENSFTLVFHKCFWYFLTNHLFKKDSRLKDL